MGLFDRSKSTSTVSNIYETSTQVDQVDQSGQSGLALSNVSGFSLSESNTVNYVDPGSLAAGVAIVDRGLATATDVIGRGLNAAGDIASGAFGLSGQALAQSGKSLDTVAKVNADSLSLLGGIVSGAIDSSKTLTRDALDANAASVNQAITGFSALAKQNSQSSDDRVAKVAQYALLAVAAVFILPAIFKGGKLA